MKLKTILIGIFLILALYCILVKRAESFKNLDNDAANELNKIVTKILPYRATCIRNAQCISGKCLETNNETTYGYCAQPIA
jgi:hypothetical protein